MTRHIDDGDLDKVAGGTSDLTGDGVKGGSVTPGDDDTSSDNSIPDENHSSVGGNDQNNDFTP